MAGQKYCRGCDTIKSIDEFSNRAPYCRPCCALQKKEALKNLTPEAREIANLSRRLARYKLSRSDFDEMFERQGGLCAAGGHPITKQQAEIDHDHACCPDKGDTCGNCVRGLLCRKCNSALGFINDDIDCAFALIAYLMRFRNVLTDTEKG